MVAQIPFAATWDEYRFKTWLKLHTSGSTGLPKIVNLKHGLISAIDGYGLLQHNETRLRYGNMRIFTPFPPFHIAGLMYTLSTIVWVDSTAVFPPAGVPITAELVHEINKEARVDHTMLAPSIIRELTQDPTWCAGLGKLKGLTFGGGPLSEETAGIVSKFTNITSSLGATEYGGIPMLPKSPEDWKYFRFNEEAAGMQFRETEQEGLFELVFVRSHDPISNLVQGIFVTFPELDEYHTKDCFSKHPSRPGLWKYEARLDDIVVLSNGEKFNPIQMEGLISTCPQIKGCLVVGQGKFQTALLVEPRDHGLPHAELAEALRPFIDQANSACPMYARISYDKLIISNADKPLPRASKGTIQRSRAVQSYQIEIEECYEGSNKSTALFMGSNIDTTSLASIETSVLEYLHRILDVGEKQIKATDDFFALGMDSLQVISLVQAINSSRTGTQTRVAPAFIYHHPTASKLAYALSSDKVIRDYSYFEDDDEEEKQTWLAMDHLFQDLRTKDLTVQHSSRRSFLDTLRSNEPAPVYEPDGGMLAWRQVLGSFLINMSNWGLVNSFGVFQTYYASTLLSGHSPSSISWIGTVQGTLLLVVGVFSGPIFDRGYFRSMQLLSGAGLVFGLMMLSLSTEYYQVMLSQGILVGICAGLLYIPSIALIPLYFKRYRGLALGLATAGGSFGGVVYPIVFRRLLDAIGFGWATRTIGFITLASLAIASLLIKPMGPRSTRNLFETSALRDLPYVSFVAAGLLLFAGLLVPYFLATDYASTTLHTSSDLSFYVLAVLNAAQFLGRVIPAILSDWIGPELLLLGAEFMAGVLGFCWIAVDYSSVAGYIVWLVAYGFISGMAVTLPPAVLPYICPNLAVIGTRLGMMYAVAGLGFLISSPVALALVRVHADERTDFLGAQAWVGACCICAAGCYLVTAIEARKRRRLYEDNGNKRSLYLIRGKRDKTNDFDVERKL